MTTDPLPPGLARNSRLDRWVEMRTDGVVEVRTGKVEIGQGITSALAQIAAEELDVDYARIRMIPADTGRSPNEGVTAGSRSTMDGGGALRQACAEVRDAFLQGRGAPAQRGRRRAVRARRHHPSQGEQRERDLLGAECRGRSLQGRRWARGAQACRSADAGRQAAAATRPAGQGGGRRRLRARPRAAGHAARPCRAPALLSRSASRLRRQADRDDAGRAGCGARRTPSSASSQRARSRPSPPLRRWRTAPYGMKPRTCRTSMPYPPSCDPDRRGRRS